MMTDHEPLTVAQAARMSGLSASTLKRRINAKQLPARYSPTGTWLIERADLLAFLAVHGPSMVAHVTAQRAGATGTTSHEPSMVAHGPSVVDHLTGSLERERTLNNELQRVNESLRTQNKELQAELLKLNAEMVAILKGEGKNLLSRWFKK